MEQVWEGGTWKNGNFHTKWIPFLITRVHTRVRKTILSGHCNESPYFWLHKKLLISLKLPLLSETITELYTLHLKVNARVRAHLLFLCLTKNFYAFHPPTLYTTPACFFLTAAVLVSFHFVYVWITPLFCEPYSRSRARIYCGERRDATGRTNSRH